MRPDGCFSSLALRFQLTRRSSFIRRVRTRRVRQLLVERLPVTHATAKKLRPAWYGWHWIRAIRQESPEFRVMRHLGPDPLVRNTEDVAEQPRHFGSEPGRGAPGRSRAAAAGRTSPPRRASDRGQARGRTAAARDPAARPARPPAPGATGGHTRSTNGAVLGGRLARPHAT